MGQPFNTPPPLPGRTRTHIQRYHLPSGQCRELRSITTTFIDANGDVRTEEVFEVYPPLSCGCIPENLHDVTECSACAAVICGSRHAAQCSRCGRSFCVMCLKPAVRGSAEAKLCEACRLEATGSVAVRVWRSIWGGQA